MLAASIRAEGGDAHAFGLDARNEADVGGLLRHGRARPSGRSRSWSSTSAPTCAFPSSRRRRRSIPRCGRWRPSPAFWPDARRRASWSRGAGGRSSSPARPRASAAARASPPSPAPSTRLRALAQSLARELGSERRACRPHRHRRRDRRRLHPRPHAGRRRKARRAKRFWFPTRSRKNYVWLHRQERSAWTFEMDLRPWTETW